MVCCYPFLSSEVTPFAKFTHLSPSEESNFYLEISSARKIKCIHGPAFRAVPLVVVLCSKQRSTRTRMSCLYMTLHVHVRQRTAVVLEPITQEFTMQGLSRCMSGAIYSWRRRSMHYSFPCWRWLAYLPLMRFSSFVDYSSQFVSLSSSLDGESILCLLGLALFQLLETCLIFLEVSNHGIGLNTRNYMVWSWLGNKTTCRPTTNVNASLGPISSVSVFGTTYIIVNDMKIAFNLMEKRSSIYSSRPVCIFGGEM